MIVHTLLSLIFTACLLYILTDAIIVKDKVPGQSGGGGRVGGGGGGDKQREK